MRRTILGRGLAAGLVLLLLPVAGRAEDVEITMRDKQFAPQQIVIDRGTVVHFLNQDGMSHNVVSHEAGNPFDLQLQKPGEVRAMSFAEPGHYTVGCDLHPRMTLEIIVK